MPLRHPFRYVAAVVVLAALACMITGLAVNRNVEIGVIGQYLFNPLILHGAWLTIVIAVVSQLIGVVLGLVVALMRQSSNFVLSSIAWLYIWFFRGTPLLVQLVFWADFGALYRELRPRHSVHPHKRGQHRGEHRADKRRGGHRRTVTQRGRLHGRDRARQPAVRR